MSLWNLFVVSLSLFFIVVSAFLWIFTVGRRLVEGSIQYAHMFSVYRRSGSVIRNLWQHAFQKPLTNRCSKLLFNNVQCTSLYIHCRFSFFIFHCSLFIVSFVVCFCVRRFFVSSILATDIRSIIPHVQYVNILYTQCISVKIIYSLCLRFNNRFPWQWRIGRVISRLRAFTGCAYTAKRCSKLLSVKNTKSIFIRRLFVVLSLFVFFHFWRLTCAQQYRMYSTVILYIYGA